MPAASSLCFRPFGQSRLKSTPAEWERKRASLISNPREWPQDLISFELWCSMTLYDPTQVNGGARFQKLMHLMLSEGTGPINQKRFDAVRDDHETGWLSTAGAARYTSRVGVAYTPATAGQHSERGAETGHNSGAPQGFVYSSREVGRQYQEPVTMKPYSKHNWLQSMQVVRGAFGTRSQTGAVQFATRGDSNVGDCLEISDCLAIGNTIAMIYGLYYYPEATPERDWTVRHSWDSRTVDVRMRMWNPRYKLINGTLLVQEPVNAHTIQAPTSGNGKKYVGGETSIGGRMHRGASFPKLFHESGYPMEPAKLLDGLVRLAPFWGTEDDADNGIVRGVRRVREVGERMASVFENCHRPSGDFYLGFNIPKAHWVYPHWVGEHDALTVSVGAVGSVSLGYQPWPEPNPNFDASRFTQWREAFLWTMPAEVEQKRRYALGYATTTPTPTTHAPTTVHASSLSTVPTQPIAADQSELVVNEREDDQLAETRATQSGVEVSYVQEHTIAATSFETLAEHELDRQTDLDADSRRSLFTSITGLRTDAVELPEGAARSRRDLNDHWKSYQFMPYPHSRLYTEARVEMVPGAVLDDAAIEQYKQRFGTAHNLYLRGETIPKSIEEIRVHTGRAIDSVLDSRISDSGSDFCRILAIYFDESDMGRQGSRSVTHDEKVRGMLGGVWASRRQSNPNDLRVHYGRPAGSIAQWVRLWGPVFRSRPAESLRGVLGLESMRGDDSQLSTDTCVEHLGNLRSEMTVREWITTPWHYAYLPYVREQSLFRDGETFSEGCVRCCRPFYEYARMYMPYKHGSLQHTQHWPTSLWRDSTTDGGLAPQPFHSEQFWSEAEPVLEMSEDVETSHVEKYSLDAGYHNWLTKTFLISASNAHLKGEYQARFSASNVARSSKRRALKGRLDNGAKPSFKEYMNVAHEPETRYSAIPQGRLSRGKVKFGQREYKLQRSTKYSNVCVDCAATLEFAPGLYRRNHREIANYEVVRGDKKRQRVTTWWINLIGRINESTDEQVDADWLHSNRQRRLSRLPKHEQRAYMRNFESTMQTVCEYLKQYHGQTQLTTRTKFTSAEPEVYIQKTVPGFADSSSSEDWQRIDAAVRTIGKMLDSNSVSAAELSDPTLRQILRETQHRYVHRSKFKRDRATPLFDPDMIRLELRNYAAEFEGERYVNCLATRTYVPKYGRTVDYKALSLGALQTRARELGISVSNKSRDALVSELVEKGPRVVDSDFRWEYYYATRVGSQGEARTPDSKPTLWRGDAWVTELRNGEYVAKPNAAERQWRQMRQSRMMVTYSLHRPVSSEEMARGLMERMAEAIYEILGNDHYLSQLLIFGYKIGGFRGSSAVSDTVSKGGFVRITETNKVEAMRHFYGDATGSSYLYDTYETHVDSVALDAGVEIGPNRKHLHFHALLTINHWSLVQIDYFAMNSLFEQAFKGLGQFAHGRFKLPGNYYSDSETPYVDIALQPQDNFMEVMAAYVRKGATNSVFDNLRS